VVEVGHWIAAKEEAEERLIEVEVVGVVHCCVVEEEVVVARCLLKGEGVQGETMKGAMVAHVMMVRRVFWEAMAEEEVHSTAELHELESEIVEVYLVRGAAAAAGLGLALEVVLDSLLP
jgi:hypothetical protein